MSFDSRRDKHRITVGLSELLDKQRIRIDDHKRGAREMKRWDDQSIDVHLHKETKYKIYGKERTVHIQIPINSDRNMVARINNKKAEIPSELYEEIRGVLKKNSQKVRELAADIITEINSYDSLLDNKQKARDALNRLSKHFDLEWTSDEIETYVNGEREVLTQIYKGENGGTYQISMNRDNIIMSDVTRGSRHGVSLTRFK